MKINRGFYLLAFFALRGIAFAGPTDLNPILEPIRTKYKLPALGAILMQDGQIAGIGAVGLRKIDSEKQVTIHDLWHLGSNTKSMTATLIAKLVEQGRLSWNMTMSNAFPELGQDINPAYRKVTLEQLLFHRAGLPALTTPDSLWEEIRKNNGSPTEQRMNLARVVLRRPPQVRPGKYLYSNAGYAIAGLIAERTTGKPWEDLMKEQLFDPLGMGSAGFGSPGDATKVDQPWGHLPKGGRLEPVPPGPEGDNPPAIAPAGTIHASLEDYAKYANLHLGESTEKGTFLSPGTLRKLHTPSYGGRYAMGWGVEDRPWAGGKALTHAGSNGMWYSVIWLAPQRDFGIIVLTNQGGESAEKACDDVASALIKSR